jgi:basic membrane protein A and related proteins
MLLGLFMILSALTGMNVAFTQSNANKTETTTVAITPADNVTDTVQPVNKRVIGLRLSQGSWSDPYNDALWQGVTNALRDTPEANFEILLFDETSSLTNDVELVFATENVSRERLERDARTHPDTHFIVLDNDKALATPLNNLHTITFEEHETSYLLGYLAGTLSQTGHIGFVGATKTTLEVANQAAFAQGLLAACSQCQLHSEFVGNNDPVQATTAAQTFTRKGADIIFADAGDSGQGVVDYINSTMCSSAVKTRPSPLTSALTYVAKNINYLSRCAGSYPLFFIGSGHYQSVSGDSDDDPTSLNHGLTGLGKHLDLAVYKTIQAFVAGDRLETGHLTLRDNAVGITLDDYNRALIPEEVLAQLDKIKTQIISGEIVVDKVLKE